MSNNVLLMHFDESSGTLNDDGPNNYGTTITGLITYSEPGIYETSIDFGGSGDATISSFNDLNGATAFTAEMWIKQNTNGFAM